MPSPHHSASSGDSIMGRSAQYQQSGLFFCQAESKGEESRLLQDIMTKHTGELSENSRGIATLITRVR